MTKCPDCGFEHICHVGVPNIKEITVIDQDEHTLTVSGAYKGFGATIVEVQVDKPPEPVDAAETTRVFQAAVLGMQLDPPDARRIGIDIHNEVDRMGYALIRKEPKRS